MSAEYAAVFPGQGAQYVGMGEQLLRESPRSSEIFERASSVLDWDLRSVMLEGPEETLNLTQYTQPALLTLSVALWDLFRGNVDRDPTMAAGLSLGEYSALVAGGALGLEDAVHLVHLRGKYMQEAVPPGVGGMAAVLGMNSDELEAICSEISRSEDFLVSPANLNCPGQVVLSGHLDAVERACEIARDSGARRAVILPVSAPFHSDLMAPARERLAEAMEEVSFNWSRFPVISNARVEPLSSPGDIKASLLEQMTSPVRWEESVRLMLDEGVDAFVEIGPKDTLTGFLRRIHRKAKGLHVETPSDVEGVVNSL